MRGWGRLDLGVDLGTANTVLCVVGSGKLLSEPTVATVDAGMDELRTLGVEEFQTVGGSAEGTYAARPLKDGVVADVSATAEMLRRFICQLQRGRWGHPRVVACVASGASRLERRAVAEACLWAGAREAHLIEAPVAAALGAGLPVEQPTGSIVLDIGAGLSEVAVIAMGGIVASRSIRAGGDHLDEAIVRYLKRCHKLLIGKQAAERIKLEIGCAVAQNRELVTEIPGRDLASGSLRTLRLTSEEIRRVLDQPLCSILELVNDALDDAPPELAWDVVERGVVLVGGGALLPGLPERVHQQTGIAAFVAASPRACAALGASTSLQTLDQMARRRSSVSAAVPFSTPAGVR